MHLLLLANTSLGLAEPFKYEIYMCGGAGKEVLTVKSFGTSGLILYTQTYSTYTQGINCQTSWIQSNPKY